MIYNELQYKHLTEIFCNDSLLCNRLLVFQLGIIMTCRFLCAVICALVFIHPWTNWNSANAQVIRFEGVGRATPLGSCFPEGGGQSCLYAASSQSADLNNDGLDDLVVMYGNGGIISFVSVAINNDDGTYSVTQVNDGWAPGSNGHPILSRLAIGDFDGDGDQDLIVPLVELGFDYYTSPLAEMSFFLGDGNGGFTPSSSRISITGSRVIGAGDLDGNGTEDLIFDNGFVLNNGDAVFATNAPVGPTSIAGISDFNGDGSLDFVRLAGSSMQIALNDGQANFSDVQTIPMGTDIRLALGDITGDSHTDIAAWSGSTPSTITGIVNDGSGNFTVADASPSTGNVGRLGDVNGDGLADLGGFQTIRLSLGDGTFSPPEPYFTGLLSDIDGDEFMDFVSFSLGAGTELSTVISKPGTSNGISPPDFLEIPNNPGSVTLGDFNADSFPDILTLNSNNISVFLSDGPRSFEPRIDQPVAFTVPLFARVADFDLDGDIDLAVVNTFFELLILFNDGNGTFGDIEFIPTMADASSMDIGDLDNDGDIDIVVSDSEDDDTEVNIFINDGSGGFSFAGGLQTSLGANQVVLLDMDNDGSLDCAASNENRVVVFTNDGNANFTSSFTEILPMALPIQALATADINADGNTDLVATFSKSEQSFLLINDGNGGFNSPASFVSHGLFSPIIAADFDNDSFVDIAVGAADQIVFHQNDGLGGLSGGLGYFSDFDSEFVEGLAAGDIDKDGSVDLVVPGQDGISIWYNASEATALLGDVNQDGNVDFLDVEPFVALLFDGLFQIEADINMDGEVDFLDVAGFVDLLVS